MTKELENFEKLISKFSFKFILANVFQELNSTINYNKIKNMIVKERLSLNSKSISKCLTKALKTNKYNEKALKRVMSSLKLLNIIEKSNKRIWHVYKFGNTNKMTSEALLDRYQNIYGKNVSIKTAQNFYWILINGQIDIYIIFSPGENFFFSSKKNLTPSERANIMKAFGGKILKPINLNGKDISSLILIIKCKHHGTFNKNLIGEEPRFIPEPPSINKSIISFNQSEARAKLANSIFGTTPPQLENFTITSNIKNDMRLMPNMKNKHINVTLKSKNVFNTFKKGIKNKIFDSEMSSILNNIHRKGENSIHISNG